MKRGRTGEAEDGGPEGGTHPSGEKAHADNGRSSPISLLLIDKFFTSSSVALVSIS
jgi:hypothetical protein